MGQKREEDRNDWRGTAKPRGFDWFWWLWDRWPIVFVVAGLLVLGFVAVTVRGAFSGDEWSSKKLALVALLVSMFGACAGVGNFVLSRFRVVGVHQVSMSFHSTRQGEGYHELQCDVRAYGAPVHDVSVRVEIFIQPSPETRRKHISANTCLDLTPVGEPRDPLSAGQGQYLVLSEPEKFDLPPDLKAYYEESDLRTRELLRMVKPRNVSLCVYCSGKRKRLRRVRSRAFHFSLSHYYGGALKVKATWWGLLSAKYQMWKIEREDRRVRTEDSDEDKSAE